MPPVINPSQGRETRLVRETAYGTTPGSPTYKRLNGIGVRLGAQIEVETFAPPGALLPTIPLINDDFTELDVEGRVDFNSITYMLASLFGPPTITALGGAPAAYQWDWLWDGRRAARPVSYTMHSGHPESTDVATGCIFNSLDIGGGRSDGFDLSGSGFGKALTAGQTLGGITNEVQTATKTGTWSGGTFTITIVETNETTAAIAYNANAATIQAAIDLLATPEPGDIVVTGGPLSTTPVVFTYGGIFAGRNVAALTMDVSAVTGSTPGVGIVTTTPGADAVSDVPPVPAGAVLGNVYLDTTWAGLGGTQLLHAYDMNLKISEKLSRVRPINKSKSSDGVIDVADQDHSLSLVLGRNATADAQLVKLRAGTRVFPRIEWLGDVISGGNSYLFQVDACLLYQSIGMPDDTDNVATQEFTGRIAIDPTSANALRVKVVNALSGL